MSISQLLLFFFSSRRRHTRCLSDWSSDVCSSDLSRCQRGSALPPNWGSTDCPGSSYRVSESGREAMGAQGYAGLAAVGLLAATLSACGIWGDGGSDIAPVEVQSDDSGLPARYGLYVEA